MRRRLGRILGIVFLLIGLFAAPRIPTVAATGSLYITPSIVTPQTVNSTFSVQVKVAGFDQFNGWEIQIVWDPTVINATGISTAVNIFQANTTGGIPFELRNCVNGAGKGCCLVSCLPLDGPGIADSAYGDTKFASGSGLLFTVTFKVVSTKVYSPINIENDNLASGGSNFVAHTTTGGSYGVPPPDFSMLPGQTFLSMAPNSSATVTVNLTSLHHFSGLVNLTATPSGKGITATLSPNQTTLSDGGSFVINLVVKAQPSKSSTSYTITLLANSSSLPPDSLPHIKQLTIFVHPTPDFTVYATPSKLLTRQASTNTTTITVKGEYKFNGTVNLTVVGPNSPRLEPTSLTILNGSNATSTLTIFTQPSPISFTDDFYVNATSGLLSVITKVTVVPPPGDFSVSANPATVMVQAGNTGIVSIGATSQDYFVGTVYVLGATKSGLGFSFDPASLDLNVSETKFLKMKITTDTSTPLGTHTIDLNLYGQLVGNAGQDLPPRQHNMTITLIISAPPQVAAPTFLGIHESVFYTLIGSLAVAFAVLGLLEVRRANKLKSRPILER